MTQPKSIHCAVCHKPIGTFYSNSLVPDNVILNSFKFDNLSSGLHWNCLTDTLAKIERFNHLFGEKL